MLYDAYIYIRFMMFQVTQSCYTPLSLHNNVGADPDIFKGEQVLQRSKKQGWDDNYIYFTMALT